MYERFDDAGRCVLVHAQEQLRVRRDRHLGTHHLVLALLVEGGEPAALLQELGVSRSDAEAEVDRMSAGASSPAVRVVPSLRYLRRGARGVIPYSSDLEGTLQLASDTAERLGTRVGPGDLLLALLDRGTGDGVELLRRLHVDLGELRRRLGSVAS